MKNMKACHVLDDVRDQLYHLGRDPSECDDLASAKPEVVAELRGRLEEHIVALPYEFYPPRENSGVEAGVWSDGWC